MSVEIQFHLAELGILFSIAITVVVTSIRTGRIIGRLEGMFKDFPPHRHINGHIVYPDGFVPSSIEDMRKRV